MFFNVFHFFFGFSIADSRRTDSPRFVCVYVCLPFIREKSPCFYERMNMHTLFRVVDLARRLMSHYYWCVERELHEEE